MIGIWYDQKRQDRRFNQPVVRKPRPRKLHVESDRLVAICGAKTPFNRRRVLEPRDTCPGCLCKNCLRSCVDEKPYVDERAVA